MMCGDDKAHCEDANRPFASFPVQTYF